MTLKQALNNSISSITNAGKRIFPNQSSSAMDNRQLMDSLSEITGMRFETIGDFLSYYKNNFFKTAYLNLNPFTAAQLAISNSWISSAIDAIVDPISNADIVPVANDLKKPFPVEEDYLSSLINHPNPIQPENIWISQIERDYQQCGATYIEVTYNTFGWPARMDRVAPYEVKAKSMNGKVYFIKNNGYVFPDNGLIPIFNGKNPFTQYKGLSPLVPLFDKLMLDQAMTEHNLRFFTKDVLKGVLSIDSNVPYESAEKELNRIQQQIKSMEEKGEAGNLAVYGATFQMLTSSNRDMLTPTISQNIIDAVKAIYHVPQSKIAMANGGSIGNGEGESQDDMMNDTLTRNMTMLLSYLNFRLLEFAGIQNTHLEFKNLTVTDEVRQGNLDTQAIENGTRTVDEVRVARNEEPYNQPWSQVPWMNKNFMPAPMLAATPEPITDASMNEISRVGVQQASLSDKEKVKQARVEDKVRKVLEDQYGSPNLKGKSYIVKATMDHF